MAFEVAQRWSVDAAGPQRPRPAGRLAGRRLGAGALTIFVHGLLLLFLLLQLFEARPPVSGSGRAPRLLSFDLPAPAAAIIKIATAESSVPSPTATPPPPLPALPVEWRPVMMRVPQQQNGASASEPASLGAAPATAAAGSAPGVPLDPYAGASPLWLPGGQPPTAPPTQARPGTLAPSSAGMAQQLRRTTSLIAIRDTVRRFAGEHAGARGSIQLRLCLTPDGQLAAATVTGGSLDAASARALGDALARLAASASACSVEAMTLNLPSS